MFRAGESVSGEADQQKPGNATALAQSRISGRKNSEKQMFRAGGSVSGEADQQKPQNATALASPRFGRAYSVCLKEKCYNENIRT